MLRIAIPSVDDRGLDSMVSWHFGRAPFYTIVSVDEGRIGEVSVVRNPFVEHSPGQIPRFLREQGVKVIIAYGMGWRAREFFSSLGIEVVVGAEGRVKQVVESFIKGALKSREDWRREPEFRHHEHHGCSD